MAEAGEDVLSGVVRRQEAALRRLEQKHGPGYGQPPPGSQSELYCTVLYCTAGTVSPRPAASPSSAPGDTTRTAPGIGLKMRGLFSFFILRFAV